MEGKTVHIVERFAPGGIETLVHDITGLDPESVVISLSGDKEALMAEWPRAKDIKNRLHAINRPQRLDVGTFWHLKHLLRKLGARNVIAHHIGPLLYGGIAAKLASVPVVYVEHDAWHYAENKRHAAILRALILVVQPKLSAVSDPVAQHLRKLTKREVTVIPPGVCPKTFKPRSKALARDTIGLPKSGYVIGSIGRLEAVKGHKYLIEALSKLSGGVSIALVGDGTERSALSAQAAKLGVADRVHFLGHRENVSALYPAFDIYCQPSLAEGLPRTVLEAQACGISVVASDVGGVRSALEPSTAKLVPPADTAALSDTLQSALYAQAPGSAAREFVIDRFSLQRTIAILNGLCEPKT